MFSIAELLDRAKLKAGIESDYRLCKVLRINQTRISNYRTGRSLPDVEMVEALCALSGDDAGLMVAHVEAARAQDGPVRNMWLSVAARLAGRAQTAFLSVLVAIALIAGYAVPAKAAEPTCSKTGKANLLYIVSITFLSVGEFLRVRLRQIPGFFWLFRLTAN